LKSQKKIIKKKSLKISKKSYPKIEEGKEPGETTEDKPEEDKKIIEEEKKPSEEKEEPLDKIISKEEDIGKNIPDQEKIVKP
jgi:hypothetical protein